MKKNFAWCMGMLGLVLGLAPLASAESLEEYCRQAWTAQQLCPPAVCVLEKADGPNAVEQCLARPCNQIAGKDCPTQFCDTLVNCRGQEICHFKMIDPPACGNLSYAGQDVPCCPGLVRRCGEAFFDDTCDMYGDNSEYSLPICIPCGDGVCTNFENLCNCPEDCAERGEAVYSGQKFDDELKNAESKEPIAGEAGPG